MHTRRPYLPALWMLLIFFPVVLSTSAQTSGGIEVKVRLLEPLDTSKTKIGQVFSATVAQPVIAGKRIVLAQGTAVEGRVAEVTRPRHEKTASMTLLLTNVIGTHSVNVFQAQALRVDGQSYEMRTVAMVGGTGATATAYVNGKHELVLPVEAELAFVVDPLSLGIKPEPQHTPAIVQTSVRRGPNPNNDRDREKDAYDSLIFSEHDQAVIRAYYYSGNGSHLPPGLAKRDGNLPPGIEKQLRANDTLPLDLQKRAEPFPIALDHQLPRLPRGYSRVMLGGRAMTLDANNRIVDLFVF
jgi:hypothetical protein